MSISHTRQATACALVAGFLGAVAVAGRPVGLGLSLALLAVVAAAAPGGRWAWLALAAALAVQPLLRDAGWVQATAALAALVAAATARTGAEDWRAVRGAVRAPLRLVAGSALVTRTLLALRPEVPRGRGWAVARGLLVAGVLVGVFAALFASADRAFAEQLEDVVSVELDLPDLVSRAVLGILFVAVAGALARSSAPSARAAGDVRWAPGRVELLIVLGALAALFAAFVVVQLQVLFGGRGYVARITGLGLGEYAREGFTQLILVVAGLLAVVAVAARRRDGVVDGLLAALCVLTLVILASAHHRLDLVEDAYGFTRTRYAGHAVVAWLAVVLVLVLAAGARDRVRIALPRAVVVLTLAGVLVFSLSDPDRRIAERAVERAQAGRPVDRAYLSLLSADALPALERLPAALADDVTPSIRARLERHDGLFGFNVARARAR